MRNNKHSRKIISIIFVILGSIFLGIGVVGIFFPILPTVPFFLLTLICYAKGSQRFERWFISTWIYKKFLHPFITTRCMTNFSKLRVILFVTGCLSIPIVLVDILWVRIVLSAVILGHWIYFLAIVPSITKAELYLRCEEADAAKTVQADEDAQICQEDEDKDGQIGQGDMDI